MKFQRDKRFDSQFDLVPALRWYPYVGKKFGENGKRIMVYAHNIPISAAKCDEKRREWSDKAVWADRMDEYTYCQGCWTNAFRYFIKGAVGLKSNYGDNSGSAIIQRVDSFVDQIAYLNFIQDLVKSDRAIARAEPEQVEVSKGVNLQILRILDISHCICWGKPVYDYVRLMKGFKVHSEKDEGQSGFSSCVIDIGGGKVMRCLRVFHPSQPGWFNPFSDATHSIISGFLGDEPMETTTAAAIPPVAAGPSFDVRAI